MVSSVASEKIPSDTNGIEPKTLRLAAQCLNPYATPGAHVRGEELKFTGRNSTTIQVNFNK